MLSECCGAPALGELSENIGRCSKCKEMADFYDEDADPTPWCNWCGAQRPEQCKCGPIPENF